MSREMKIALVGLVWAVAMATAAVVWRSIRRRQRVRGRLYAGPELPPTTEDSRNGFVMWLVRAGYRSPTAPAKFLTATAAAFGLGIVVLLVVLRSGLGVVARRALEDFPGGIGEIFLPILYVGPWVLALTVAMLPTLLVRAARRTRVERIEQDLPLFLELLATLSEAGLGLDAGVDRILRAEDEDRPLFTELRFFQRDLLAGRPRVAALRRLAARVDVSSLSSFISALVQAEQSGAGIAGVLRRQADDLRDRRRERAIGFATALTVKLLFPLVICFLPGIFVATLGPTFFQFFQLADKVIRNQPIGP